MPKSNCKWASRKEQNRNRRTTVYYTIDGNKYILKDFIKVAKVGYTALWKRIKSGWNLHDAINTPSTQRRHEDLCKKILLLKKKGHTHKQICEKLAVGKRIVVVTITLYNKKNKTN